MSRAVKTVAALAFVGVVAMAAAAFGQAATPSRSNPPAVGEKHAKMHSRMVHSETKVQTDTGFATVIADAGEITAVDGNSVTIKRLDGETVTVTAGQDTKIRRNGEAAEISDLEVGDRAHIVQMVQDGTTTVRAIRAADETFTPERRHGPRHRRGPRPGGPAEDAEGAGFFAA